MSDGSAPWIKVMTRIFEDPKIIAIRELPDGDAITLVWFQLLCMGGEQNRGGAIYFTESVPFTVELLAAKWRCKPALVQMALSVFRRFTMIGIDAEGTIWILNWAKYQNEVGLAQIRERNLKQLEDRSPGSVEERAARKRQQAAERQRRRRNRRKENGSMLEAIAKRCTDNPRARGETMPGSEPNGAVTRDTRDGGVTITLQCNDSQRETVTLQNKTENKNTEEEAPCRPPFEGDIRPQELVRTFAEAKRLICRLILNGKDPARPWSYQAEEALSRQLPIPLVEIERVAWFRNLPDDPKMPELVARRVITECGLCTHWGDEVTRANAFWSKVYGVDVVKKKEPPLWREFFTWKNDERVVLPHSFFQLDRCYQQEYERDFATFVKAKSA